MGEDQKLLPWQTEKVWKRKLCHPHWQGILMFFSGTERKEMKRGKERDWGERGIESVYLPISGLCEVEEMCEENRNLPGTCQLPGVKLFWDAH